MVEGMLRDSPRHACLIWLIYKGKNIDSSQFYLYDLLTVFARVSISLLKKTFRIHGKEMFHCWILDEI